MTTIQVITLFIALATIFFAFIFSLINFIKIKKSKKNLDSNYVSIAISVASWIVAILLSINYCMIMI